MRKRHTSKHLVIERFLGIPEIAAFVIVVILVSVVFFPKKEIIRTILKYPYYISPQYIKDVIMVNPDDQLKLALIRNYMASGKYKRAKRILKTVHFTFDQINFLDYIGLRYRLLKTMYYDATDPGKKKIAKNKIKASLSMMGLIGQAEFKKYLSSNGEKWLGWMLDAYKFEKSHGEYGNALLLINHYLEAFPEYRGKYYKDITLLCLFTGNESKAYEMLDDYVKNNRSYEEKSGFFETVAKRSILGKDRKLTKLLIGMYKRNFSGDLKIEKFILTYALRSGDPYFARDIAVELNGAP